MYRTRRDRDPDTGAAKDDQHFELSFGEVSFFSPCFDGALFTFFMCRYLHHHHTLHF